jgi:phage terminase large subunit
MIITAPYKFKPRSYQWPIFKAMFGDLKKRAVLVWHRRAGKDKTCLNIMVMKAMERVGVYYYLFPEISHARRVIWNGIDKDGMRFIDHIPPEIIKGKPNQSEMRITLINGSIIQLGGVDQFDRIMGTNPVGVVLSEYSLQNPMGWQYLSPILAENGGWVIFEYTPRGKNHGYHMLNAAKFNDNFFCQVLTVHDTGAISLEEIDKLRKEGVDEETIQQEFFCSFDSAVKGAYYAEALRLANQQNRIRLFDISPHAPTYTFWDLGVRDPLAIWVMQKVGTELRMCFYFENSGGGIKNAIEWLFQLKQKYGLIWAEHFAPHDIGTRCTMSGRSRAEEAADAGLNFTMVRRAKRVIDDINATRGIFHRVHFHATNCEQGLATLQEYHAHFDEKNQISGEPVHNWASHGADAFRTFGIAWCEYIENPHQYRPIQREDWSVTYQ